MTTALLWFRRDLRLSDNPALVEAVRSADEVVGAFCLDPALLGPAGDARRSHLFRCLIALDESMDGNLVVRTGDPTEVIPELAVEVGAASVHLAEDFGPYGRRRDDVVAERVVDAGMELVRTGSPYAVPPGSVMNKSGAPYKVFTPFSRAWRDHGWPEPVRRPSSVPWRRAPGDAVPEAPDLGDVDLPRAGEAAAGHRLDHFLRAKVEAYDDARDRPGADATSRLSPDLKWGTLHPRQILSRLGRTKGEQTFATELCWREFYADVLFHRPESARESMDEAVGSMPWDRGAGADELFEAWSAGPDRVPDRGCRYAPAPRRGLDAQPGPDDHGELLREGPAPRLAARRPLVHAAPGRRRPGVEPARLAVDGGHRHRRRALLPDLQPHDAGRAVRPRRRRTSAGGCPSSPTSPSKWIHRPVDDPEGPPEGYPRPIVDHAEERSESLRRYEATR